MDLSALLLLHLLCTTVICILPPIADAATAGNDTAALLLFRSQADSHGNLLPYWTTSSTTCPSTWLGVRCLNNRVSGLSLPNLNLRGSIDSLSSLDQLRLLDLHNNRLNGTLYPLTRLTNLKLIYLSRNDFSGQIPPEISSLHRLLRLELSDNNLIGPLPPQLSNLSRLLTLHLDNNAISGPIPPSLVLLHVDHLNLSNNELYGRVPIELLRRFGANCFMGNSGLLCGGGISSTDHHPIIFPQLCSSDFPLSSPASPQTVQSSPSSIPSNPIIVSDQRKQISKRSLSRGAVVALLVSNSLLIFLIIVIFLVCCCNNCSKAAEDDDNESAKNKNKNNKKKKINSHMMINANANANANANESTSTSTSTSTRLVFFDRRKEFELVDLLGASAEMIGKGSVGTVYRVVLEDEDGGGTVLAVKRLKDANPCARKEFEQYMDVIGRLRHPNVVRLKAYYYAKEEKLLVYDYLSNGTLFCLLHGRRKRKQGSGPGGRRIPVDWTTRISLVLGAARGLARIHSEYMSSKIPHGNVTSSNVLVDKNGLACISDFGLSLLLHPAHAIARLGAGYRAPEQSQTKKLSQQADVYSFGVILLEVLTGKAPPSQEEEEEEEVIVDLPKWVGSVVRSSDEWRTAEEVFDKELLRYNNIEEELLAMLRVAMACVVAQPEKRPSMIDVVKMIEEIRVELSPLGEEYYDDDDDDDDQRRNSLSPSIVTTE
ncbi:hypothetical protein Dimus_034699 [Dionaea muscipula]